MTSLDRPPKPWKVILNLFGCILLALAAPSVLLPVARAASIPEALSANVGKRVTAVRVEGNKRIENAAILAKVSPKVGERLRREQPRADVEALFKMGYFEDIEVDVSPSGDGVAVTYRVKERPAITKIEFSGNDRISTKDLQEVTKVKQYSILDLNRVKADVAALQKHYEDKGYYLARVSYELKTIKADEVELVFKINDYDKVQIKKITFLNNTRFSDSQLKATLGETREGGFWSFMTSSGNFKESSFKTDLQRLTYFYLDNGYVKFKYDNPVVTISDDKRYLFISIYVEEGEQYSIGSLAFSGDVLFPKSELYDPLKLKEGDTFSISKRNTDIQHLTEQYQDLGYAFTNVVPKMDIRDDTKLVNIDYSFEKGSLAYFGGVTVVGNTKTHDKVIRRELKFSEGELYNGTKFRESREAVERLGFFQPGEVLFNTSTPKDRGDIVNTEIQVKERNTGTVTVGAGYGSVQKFFFQTQVAEINLFGRGQNLSLTGQMAADRKSKSFNLGFTDPYSFDSKWSLGFDIFFTTFPIPNKYTTRKLGFNLRAGYPLFEDIDGYITYKNEGLKIEDVDDPNVDPQDIAADEGVLSSIVWSVIRDKRNNRFETTRGNYQMLSLETAGLGGDKRFAKWGGEARYYTQFGDDLIFRTRGEYGQIASLESGRRVPPSEKYFLGGPNNLRGFSLFSVGPQRVRPATTLGGGTVLVNEPVGGEVQLLTQGELEYPIIREAGLKFVGFIDAGNAYTDLPAFNQLNLRSNWGLGLRWFSPIGPLRFEWGFPFQRKPGEDAVNFYFFIGPPF